MDEFYRKMDKIPPKKKKKKKKMFLDAINESDGDVEIITISSKLSGTYNSAKAAASLSGKDVKVVDSLQASVGLGLFIRNRI